MPTKDSIVVTGAAGLVGQNLILRLKERGYTRLIGIDKHRVNTSTLSRLNPDIQVIEADLAIPGQWEDGFSSAKVLVLNHSELSAIEEQPFIDNNITATANVLAAAKRHHIPYIVHISSCAVKSSVYDYYVATKAAQEKMVIESGIPCCVLRPTLMFGWFDRKHLSWLARFMARSPVFPIPGHGRYRRQPLYVADFCDVIVACIEKPRPSEVYNISGHENIDYIDLMRAVRDAAGVRTAIVQIPRWLFRALLSTYALVDPHPPFTVKQLASLTAADEFEIIDWPSMFGVGATPLHDALQTTFRHPTYSRVALEF